MPTKDELIDAVERLATCCEERQARIEELEMLIAEELTPGMTTKQKNQGLIEGAHDAVLRRHTAGKSSDHQ